MLLFTSLTPSERLRDIDDQLILLGAISTFERQWVATAFSRRSVPTLGSERLSAQAEVALRLFASLEPGITLDVAIEAGIVHLPAQVVGHLGATPRVQLAEEVMNM